MWLLNFSRAPSLSLIFARESLFVSMTTRQKILSQYGVMCKRGEGNTNSERQVCSESIITPLLIASSLSHTAYRSRRSEDQRAFEEGQTL